MLKLHSFSGHFKAILIGHIFILRLEFDAMKVPQEVHQE